MELIIDTREKALIEILENKNTNITIQQLDLGDVIFKKGEETVLVIERKTISDLKASICDGRNREQKARLQKSYPNQRILYLVEGSFDKNLEYSVSGMPISTLLGSMINTQYRDDIKVYKTQSINETANYLIKLLEKLNKELDNFFNNTTEITDEKYSATIKKSKKANMTPNVWFISTLCLIPQVTEKIASVIINNYSSLNFLLTEYEKTPEHLRYKLLSDLKYELSSGKLRRIGDSISKRVYEYCYGITE